MPVELFRYNEPLTADELEFMEKKEARERNMYYKVYRVLMVLSFVFPFAGAWYRAYDGAPNAFSPARFFLSAGILLSISTIATYVPYRFNLRRVQLDTRHKTKTIEISHVKRKVHAAEAAYYFYIDSSIKLSIEVSQADYVTRAVGDEVCIEYATYSKEYFGYF